MAQEHPVAVGAQESGLALHVEALGLGELGVSVDIVDEDRSLEDTLVGLLPVAGAVVFVIETLVEVPPGVAAGSRTGDVAVAVAEIDVVGINPEALAAVFVGGAVNKVVGEIIISAREPLVGLVHAGEDRLQGGSVLEVFVGVEIGVAGSHCGQQACGSDQGLI